MENIQRNFKLSTFSTIVLTAAVFIATLLFTGCPNPTAPQDEEQTENNPPTVTVEADTASADPGIPINFMAAAADADNDTLTYTWSLDDAEVLGESEAAMSYTFTDAGSYTAAVTVSDGTDTAEAAATVSINHLEIAGTWLLSNIDLSDGHTAGTDGLEWIIDDSVYTVIYTGPAVYGNFSYGTTESYRTADKNIVVQQTDDNLDPSANGQYFKQTYTITSSGNLRFTTYEEKSTAAEAVNSTTVVWGQTDELPKVTDTVHEITGVWVGTDSGGEIEYAFTPTKFGFERFDDFAFGAGTGGGDIISVDNSSNTIIFQMIRHSIDGSQENQYFKLIYTPAEPVNAKDSEISITIYGPHGTQNDAENDTTPDNAAHTVVRQ